jgi:hypothetical protein
MRHDVAAEKGYAQKASDGAAILLAVVPIDDKSCSKFGTPAGVVVTPAFIEG